MAKLMKPSRVRGRRSSTLFSGDNKIYTGCRMELVSARPICDTLALLILLNAAFHYLSRAFLFEPGPWAHVLVALPTIVMISRVTSQPDPHSNEPRATKRVTRARPPILWAMITRLWLFLLGEVPLYRKGHTRRQKGLETRDTPQVRFVDETQVGFMLLKPSVTRFVINGLEWTQVYRNDETQLAVLYGLCPGTIYEAQAHQPSQSHPLDFSFCTALLPTSDQKPRKLATPIHDIALESAKEALANERAQVRKFRRESLKRLAAVRHDTEAMDHKVATKRKADERAKKRIAALQERIAQLSAEIAAVEGADDNGDLAEVTELANKAQSVMLERQSKQQDFDVGVRVWVELQSSKQADVHKLRQRCEKLQDRVKKLDHDLSQQASIRELDIEAYLTHIREQRNIRKHRRARLESDFVQAINKLDAQ